MNYILNEPWCLRGWKNKPYCLCDFTSPANPVGIMERTSQDIADHNPKCRECEYLTMCGGGCRMSAFEKTGDLMGYDPQMYSEKAAAASRSS